MNPTDDAGDLRAREARAWALAALGLADARFGPASADASFRRYFRATHGGLSWIVMDAPPPQEDCRPFVAVAGMLTRWGLRAPEVLAQDLERGFLLLSDLGTQTFLDVLTPDNARALYDGALSALVQMQARSLADADARRLPPYDAALLWREARLFGDWYLPRHLGTTLDSDEAAALEAAVGRLVDAALAQPCCFVHRDFMPRNLMAGAGAPGILDFQDAVWGPIAYDPVCLFKDAFLSWPADFVRDGLHRYWEAARAARLPVPPAFEGFLRQAEWIGLQRHLKVLGIFARLTHRDGKPRYVADTPRFVRYVMDVAPRYPELAGLSAVFERHVLPRVSP